MHYNIIEVITKQESAELTPKLDQPKDLSKVEKLIMRIEQAVAVDEVKGNRQRQKPSDQPLNPSAN